MLWHEQNTGEEIEKHGMREDKSWGAKHGTGLTPKEWAVRTPMTYSEGIVGSQNGFSSLVLKDSTPEHWDTYKWGPVVEKRLQKL